jgi:type I restriction enzyme, S subunit
MREATEDEGRRTEGPYQLPAGWVWTTLANACEIVMGQSPPSDTYNTDGIGLPFFQGKAEFGALYPTPVKWCSNPGKIAEAGDILISVRAPVGPTNLCRERSCIGRGLAAIRPLDGMPAKYFLYALRLYQEQLVEKATGTTFQAIGGKVLRDQLVPLAPTLEQIRIVAKIEELLTSLDAGVSGLKRIQAALKRYRAAVLKAACEGRLVPQDSNDEPAEKLLERILAERRAKWEADLRATGKDPQKASYEEPKGPVTDGLPRLPEGWCWATLDQLSQLITSGSRGWSQYYSYQGPLFVRAQDINTDKLAVASVAHVDLPVRVEGARTLIFKNDLLITITGANVTKTALVQQALPEAYVSQHVGLVRPVEPRCSQYLYYWIIAPTHGRRALEKAAYGAGKPGLSLVNLGELAIGLAPLDEERRIVAEVERRLSVVRELEKMVDVNLMRAERLRQAILRRAFEGKLVVQKAGNEPSSVLLERVTATNPPDTLATKQRL